MQVKDSLRGQFRAQQTRQKKTHVYMPAWIWRWSFCLRKCGSVVARKEIKMNVGKSKFPAICCMFQIKWGRVGGIIESITHFSWMSQSWVRDHRQEKPRSHVRGGITKPAKSTCEHLKTAFFFLCLNLEKVNINPSAYQCKLGNNTNCELVNWGKIK